MNINYELILFSALVLCGLIGLVDVILASKRASTPKSKITDYARSFFPILLIVFSIRSFGYEPRYIPSGSLEPTLLVGDFVLVNKFDYGIRLPILHKKILAIGEPQHGDIVVFRGPSTENRDLIKRVIGVPGDHLVYKDKILFINGKEMPQTFVKYASDHNDDSNSWLVEQKQEYLFGISHGIYQIPGKPNDDFDVIVPKGEYFMMGDNRDNSADSRYWGFMPDKDIIGKANYVLASIDSIRHPVRWNRIASKII